MKAVVAVLFFSFAALAARAAEAPALERDLGQGLAYVRIHALPADLPPTPPQPRALVVDLRYTHATHPGVTTLGAWLQFRASAHVPVLVLVNSATSPIILDFLESTGSLPGMVTLGGASLRYVPDVALKISAATERRAYDALEHGATAESLLNDTPDKPRQDEASLAQAAAPGATTEDEDVTPDEDRAAEITAPKPPPPLIDVTLQRAVQLHRALVALRRVK